VAEDAAKPTDDQVRQQVRDIIAEYFGFPAEQISAQMTAHDVEGWDSTRHVGLILEIEEALGFEFDIERISAFENIGQLIEECVRMVAQR
jgi:acyl carrier protein